MQKQVQGGSNRNVTWVRHCLSKVLIFEGPHFFDFPEFRQMVGEKEEDFQHSGLESRILDNIARLGASVALDT